MIAILGLLLAGIGFDLSARAQPALPFDPVSFEILSGDEVSFLRVSFWNLPRGWAISNTLYRGWCVEYEKPIMEGQTYRGRTFDSGSPELPPHLAGQPWDRLNYILNHRRGTMPEVQEAIWGTLGQMSPPFSANAQAMIDEAARFGQGFKPSGDQVCTVILDQLDTNFQRILFEMPCACSCTNTGEVSEMVLAVISYQPGQAFVGRVYGVPDECYIIEASSDLKEWVEVYSVRSVAEFVEFRDLHPTPERRFYRARARRDP
ncbi:MAG TPA: hypothetical protein VNO52_05470 [Methylomirabilota bacterium]|nr:hypothetical protein [Methylomirabilota bacterium]